MLLSIQVGNTGCSFTYAGANWWATESTPMHVIISACSPWSCSHLPLTQRGAGCSGSLSLALDLQLRCTPRHTDAMLMEYHTCIYRRGLVIILMLTFIYFQYENACMYNCVYMPVQNPHRLAVPLVLRYHTVYVLRVHYSNTSTCTYTKFCPSFAQSKNTVYAYSVC